MKLNIKIFLLLLLLLFSIHISLFIGKYPISFSEYISFIQYYLLGSSSLSDEKIEILNNILFNIRFPRIITAVLIGASLGIAGSTFQAIFVNPLVSPGILGVLAGSSFGAALGLILSLPWFAVQLLTFLFGFCAVGLSLLFLFFSKASQSSIVLILGGIISSALFTAFLSILKYSADPYDVLPTIVFWLMGTLSYSNNTTLVLVFIPMLFGIIILSLSSKYFNALSLGDEEAKALGINIHYIKFYAILFATLISSLTVVLAGVIGWIGLIIPHITRLLFGANNTIVVPLSAIIGGIFLLITDTFSRSLFEYEIPIGVLTSIVGIFIFIFIFIRRKSAI
ncbi:MAG: iron ABC transporter permease [Aliarcobacter sp.]|nr:iron ABC transporter permease [Aliarcobacter sp.]